LRKLIKKITVNSLYEAESKIYDLIIENYSPKEITQIEFVIQGISRHSNITQISQIKKRFENKHKKESEDKDPLTAFFFRQFDNRKKVKDVVIETGYKPKKVKKAHDEYLELEEKVIVPKWFIEDLKAEEIRFERHYSPSYVFKDSEEGLSNIIVSFRTFVDNAVNE